MRIKTHRVVVDRHEQVTPRGFVSHLKQILHIDVQVTRLIGFEGAVLRLRRTGLQLAQVTHGMPAKASIQPRARDIEVQKFAHNRQQVIERDHQRLAHRNGANLLSRRQRRLQPMRRVAAVLDAFALAPLVDGLRGNIETRGQRRPGLVAPLDRRTQHRGGRRLPVKMDQHRRPPARMFLRTHLVMNSADRRGEI